MLILIVLIIEADKRAAACQYFVSTAVDSKYGHKKQTRVNFSIKISF